MISGIEPIQQSNNLMKTINRTDDKKQKDSSEVKKVEKEHATEDDVLNAVENANKALVFHNIQLEFSIHKKTKEIMVKVIDKDTNKVIREIPPKKVLDMVAHLWEMAGILVDERR